MGRPYQLASWLVFGSILLAMLMACQTTTHPQVMRPLTPDEVHHRIGPNGTLIAMEVVNNVAVYCYTTEQEFICKGQVKEQTSGTVSDYGLSLTGRSAPATGAPIIVNDYFTIPNHSILGILITDPELAAATDSIRVQVDSTDDALDFAFEQERSTPGFLVVAPHPDLHFPTTLETTVIGFYDQHQTLVYEYTSNDWAREPQR